MQEGRRGGPGRKGAIRNEGANAIRTGSRQGALRWGVPPGFPEVWGGMLPSLTILLVRHARLQAPSARGDNKSEAAFALRTTPSSSEPARAGPEVSCH